MVWGGIMGNRKTELVVIQGNLNAQRYIAEVLTPHAMPLGLAIERKKHYCDTIDSLKCTIVIVLLLQNYYCDALQYYCTFMLIQNIPWDIKVP